MEASMEAVEAFADAVEVMEGSLLEAAEFQSKGRARARPRRSLDLALPLPSNLAPDQRFVT